MLGRGMVFYAFYASLLLLCLLGIVLIATGFLAKSSNILFFTAGTVFIFPIIFFTLRFWKKVRALQDEGVRILLAIDA